MSLAASTFLSILIIFIVVHVSASSHNSSEQLSVARQSDHSARIVNEIRVYEKHRDDEDERHFLSLIIFGYVSTLCLFAFIGLIGLAIITCCEGQRIRVNRTQNRYQTLE